MANDKGAQRLTAPLFSSFGDFTVDRHMKALRIHHCPRLGTIPSTNASARTIHFTRGLSLYRKLESQDRTLTGRTNFAQSPSVIKVFY